MSKKQHLESAYCSIFAAKAAMQATCTFAFEATAGVRNTLAGKFGLSETSHGV